MSSSTGSNSCFAERRTIMEFGDRKHQVSRAKTVPDTQGATSGETLGTGAPKRAAGVDLPAPMADNRTNLPEYEKIVLHQAAEAAASWFRQGSRDPFVDLYLYFRPSSPGAVGQLHVGPDAPEGFELADPRRIHGNQTELQACHWIAGVSRRLPILDPMMGR